MTQTRRRRRTGAYAKGVAKREEILKSALQVVAREGYRGASVQEIADAVGLSQAGLLHYFESKDELFTEILRARDTMDREAFHPDPKDPRDMRYLRERYLHVFRRNAGVPGLVQLFSRLAVDAADPQHAAHGFFLHRGEVLRQGLAEIIAEAQSEGAVTDAVPAETFARVILAVSDGVQLQWMLDPSTDMPAVIEALFAVLAPSVAPQVADEAQAAPTS